MKKVTLFSRNSPPHFVTLIMLAAIPALSMTLFLPSLPNMASYFETSYQFMQLSVPAYLFVTALLHIVIGPLSDRFGRRPLVILSVIVFIIATLGCILSPNIEIFLAFRMLQSIIASGMVLTRAIIRDMFPPDKAASMIGYVTMGMAVPQMFGPMAGGLLDELYGWQASFSLLMLLGFLILVLSVLDQGETVAEKFPSMISQFRQYPELFGSRRFWVYCLIASFASGTFFAYLGGAPFVGSQIFGLSSSMVGFFFGMAALGYIIGNFASGQFSTRFGINRMVIYGTIIGSLGPLGSVVCHLVGISHPLSFFGFAVFMGIGNGLVLPNSTVGMMSVRPHLAGTASGVGGAFLIAGGSILAALAGSMLTPDSGPIPLYMIMLFSMLSAFLFAIILTRLDRPLEAPKLH